VVPQRGFEPLTHALRTHPGIERTSSGINQIGRKRVFAMDFR